MVAIIGTIVLENIQKLDDHIQFYILIEPLEMAQV